MNLDHATPELFAALSLAQGEIENAAKSSTNPHFRSKYADLAEVLNTIRPVFSKHGLSIIQSTSFDGSLVHVECIVACKTGGYITSTASCVPAKTDAQGIGAATTYLRRYSLAAMAGIAQEDDDGNSASHGKTTPATVRNAEKITDDQAANLQAMIDEVGADKEAFLKYMGVESLAAIPASAYKGAVAALEKKRKK